MANIPRAPPHSHRAHRLVSRSAPRPTIFAILTSKTDVAREGLIFNSNRSRWLVVPLGSLPLASTRSREDTPEISLENASIMISSAPDQQPRKPDDGLVFGNSTNELNIDVVIALSAESGVSKKHFAIKIDPASRAPRITNLSRFGTRITSTRHQPIFLKGENSSATLENGDTIRAGFAWLELFIPRELEQVEIERQRMHHSIVGARANRIPSSSTSSEPQTVFATDVVSLVITTIGKGARGTVYPAYDCYNKEYAVKVFQRSSMEEVENQKQLLAGLDHPHIVSVFPSLRVTPGTRVAELPYIIMERGERSLHGYAGEVDDVETIFSQLFEVVCFLHAQGIMHGDLKPQNILTRPSKLLHILLCDFDTAKWDIPLSQFRGTPRYTAPEVARSQRDGPEETQFYTKKVDVWSIGVMLLEYCFGENICELKRPAAALDGYEQVEDANKAIISFLGRNVAAKSGYEHLAKLARAMVVADPDERPDISICQSFFRKAKQDREVELARVSDTESATDNESGEDTVSGKNQT